MKKTTNKSKSNSARNERFPGYKSYPASDDIVNRGEQVEGDVEDLLENRSIGNNDTAEPMSKKKNPNALSHRGNKQFEEDEELRDRVAPVDFTGNDLDVPGSELDDDNEVIGNEDEENNLYSLGGDKHDNDEHRE